MGLLDSLRVDSDVVNYIASTYSVREETPCKVIDFLSVADSVDTDFACKRFACPFEVALQHLEERLSALRTRSTSGYMQMAFRN